MLRLQEVEEERLRQLGLAEEEKARQKAEQERQEQERVQEQEKREKLEQEKASLERQQHEEERAAAERANAQVDGPESPVEGRLSNSDILDTYSNDKLLTSISGRPDSSGSDDASSKVKGTFSWKIPFSGKLKTNQKKLSSSFFSVPGK